MTVVQSGQAFKSYDEAGAVRRIQCLKYLVLATMLMESAVDPFDAQARLWLLFLCFVLKSLASHAALLWRVRSGASTGCVCHGRATCTGRARCLAPSKLHVQGRVRARPEALAPEPRCTSGCWSCARGRAVQPYTLSSL